MNIQNSSNIFQNNFLQGMLLNEEESSQYSKKKMQKKFQKKNQKNFLLI